MTPEGAEEIVAQYLTARAIEMGADLLEWEDYPDIGERDWMWAVAGVRGVGDDMEPSRPAFDEAYAVLKKRADQWAAEHEGARP